MIPYALVLNVYDLTIINVLQELINSTLQCQITMFLNYFYFHKVLPPDSSLSKPNLQCNYFTILSNCMYSVATVANTGVRPEPLLGFLIQRCAEMLSCAI